MLGEERETENKSKSEKMSKENKSGKKKPSSNWAKVARLN